MKIGIFDTGTGGKLVAKRLEKLLPQHLYITAIDREHAPYGNRSPEEIIALTDAAIQPLLSLARCGNVTQMYALSALNR